MRRLFSFIFRLIFVVLVIFLLTAAVVVYIGLNDQGDHADVAVVLGSAVRKDGTPGVILRARLDLAVERYKQGLFPLIIVSGATRPEGYDEADVMAKYLESHEVPNTAIIADHHGMNTMESARNVASIMKTRSLKSVMIVTHYYQIARMKLALKHEGINEIEQVHAGKLDKADWLRVGREVVAINDYIFQIYVLPAAEKAKEEAAVGLSKAETEAEKAKENVNKSLDSMDK